MKIFIIIVMALSIFRGLGSINELVKVRKPGEAIGATIYVVAVALSLYMFVTEFEP